MCGILQGERVGRYQETHDHMGNRGILCYAVGGSAPVPAVVSSGQYLVVVGIS